MLRRPLSLGWCVWLALGAAQVAAASVETQTFADPKEATAWHFSDGPEWPGAQGRLEHLTSGGRGGDADGALALHFDFTKGGNYVAATTNLPTEPPVVAVRLWLKKDAGNLLFFRAADSKGETHQKEVRYEYHGWQQLEITLDSWTYSWGGDGKFDGPPREFHILIEGQGGTRSGTLLIDDVEWLRERPADDTVATTTYTESTFDHGWSPGGPAGARLDGTTWHYAFSSDANTCTLGYGWSALAEPQALKLTLISDGSGHELKATCGSHFQSFERPLGTLDQAGEVTLEVPMGDMSSWRHFGGEDDGMVRDPLRLEQLALVKKGTADSGQIELRKLAFVTRYPRQRPVIIVPHVRAPDADSAQFSVELRSLHNEPLTGTLTSDLGEPAPRQQDITVPAGGRTTVQIAAPWPAAANVAQGTFTFQAGALGSAPASVTIARTPDLPEHPALDPNSRMGVGVYLYRFSKDPQARERMTALSRLAAAAGVKWTREEFHWNWMEPQPGQWDFSFYDQLVDVATAQGISIYGLMCYWTEWNKPPFTDEFIEHYCNYLKTVVGRYKDRIKHWEIWNEPNIFFFPDDKTRYAALLKRAYQTIKSVDPDAEVLGCSTAGIDVAFIKLVLEHKAPFDALTVHPYRHQLDVPAFIDELERTRELVGGRDIWITEMGWPSNIGGLTERQQASYVARTYIGALAAPGMRSVSWYDFREDGAEPFYNEHHFGIVRSDLTPKAGYAALATVGRLLGSAMYVGPLKTRDAALCGYVWRSTAGASNATYVTALWPTDQTRFVTLMPDVTAAKSLTGDALATRLGDAWLLARNEPAYFITAQAPELPAQAEPPVTFGLTAPAVHPGDTVTLTWKVVKDCRVAPPSVPPNWSATPGGDGTLTITVAPEAADGSHTLWMPVTRGADRVRVPLEIAVMPKVLRR